MAAWEALCLETLQFELLDVCTVCQDLMICFNLALQLCSFAFLSGATWVWILAAITEDILSKVGYKSSLDAHGPCPMDIAGGDGEMRDPLDNRAVVRLARATCSVTRDLRGLQTLLPFT